MINTYTNLDQYVIWKCRNHLWNVLYPLNRPNQIHNKRVVEPLQPDYTVRIGNAGPVICKTLQQKTSQTMHLVGTRPVRLGFVQICWLRQKLLIDWGYIGGSRGNVCGVPVDYGSSLPWINRGLRELNSKQQMPLGYLDLNPRSRKLLFHNARLRILLERLTFFIRTSKLEKY